MSKIQQIQLFLEGRLSDEALEVFERQVQEDAEFRKEVNDYKVIFSGLDQLRHEAFENKIRAWNKDLPPLAEAPKQAIYTTAIFRRVAAAVFIIAFSALGYSLFNSGNSLKGFGEKNYIELALNLHRGGENASVDFRLAEISFAKKEYAECIAQLNQIDAQNPLYLKAQYLKEHSFYQSGKYPEAIKAFEAIDLIVGQGQSKYEEFDFNKENAEWTALLARLALYQVSALPAEKEVLLRQIQNFIDKNPEEAYRDKALRLALELK